MKQFRSSFKYIRAAHVARSNFTQALLKLFCWHYMGSLHSISSFLIYLFILKIVHRVQVKKTNTDRKKDTKIQTHRPRHQTEIVNGAHPGGGARIAYTRAMSEHRCFPKKETKYSYNAFQMTSQKSI